MSNVRKCFTCESEEEIVEQLCGFWFCSACIIRAREKGAYYYMRLYRALYPWRFED